VNRDPYENALAERMNGIIKNEFNLYNSSLNFEQTYELINQSVDSYNNLRPHSSIDYLTPSQAHLQNQPLKKRWKQYPGYRNHPTASISDQHENNCP